MLSKLIKVKSLDQPSASRIEGNGDLLVGDLVPVGFNGFASKIEIIALGSGFSAIEGGLSARFESDSRTKGGVNAILKVNSLYKRRSDPPRSERPSTALLTSHTLTTGTLPISFPSPGPRSFFTFPNSKSNPHLRPLN